MLNIWLQRFTRAIHYNVSAGDMNTIYGEDFSSYANTANWLYDPDLTAVEGWPLKYWVITGDVVTLMNQGERDAVDAAELDGSRDETTARLDDVEDISRAFMIIVKDEINILRGQHSLAERTTAQMKAAIRGQLGN